MFVSQRPRCDADHHERDVNAVVAAAAYSHEFELASTVMLQRDFGLAVSSRLESQ